MDFVGLLFKLLDFRDQLIQFLGLLLDLFLQRLLLGRQLLFDDCLVLQLLL